MRALAILAALAAAGCDDVTAILPDGGGDMAPPFFHAVDAPDANFFAVSGSSPTNVVMVGSGGAIARWNGQKLTVESSGTDKDLRGVFVAADDVAWAVGEQGTVVRWNGDHWTVQTSGSTGLLNAVWADRTQMLAVGAKGEALAFDTKFHAVVADSPDDLHAVTGGAQGIYAVGTLGTLSKYDGMMLHRTAVSGYSKTLAGATTGPGGSWFVGLGGAVYRYDGSPNAVAGVPPVFLRGVAAPGKEVFVVGFDGLVARLVGADVVVFGGTPMRSYEGVYAATSDDVWVVGASGTVLHSTPASGDGGVKAAGDAGAPQDGGGGRG